MLAAVHGSVRPLAYVGRMPPPEQHHQQHYTLTELHSGENRIRKIGYRKTFIKRGLIASLMRKISFTGVRQAAICKAHAVFVFRLQQ